MNYSKSNCSTASFATSAKSKNEETHVLRNLIFFLSLENVLFTNKEMKNNRQINKEKETNATKQQDDSSTENSLETNPVTSLSTLKDLATACACLAQEYCSLTVTETMSVIFKKKKKKEIFISLIEKSQSFNLNE